MKRKLLGGTIVSVLSLWFVFAAPVRFDVTVQPNPIKASEFADVTIKALDENGNVDTSYTDGDIWIEVEWFEYTDPDVVIPWGWIGFFEASDQWIKIFSKGLTIKKAGTYTVSVVDVYDTDIVGETEVQVLADSDGPAMGTIDVTNPIDGMVTPQDSMSVVWSTSFPNTPIVMIIDGAQVQEWLSDQQGNFVVPISWYSPWKHTLEVNALNLEDAVVASSWPISFTYDRAQAPLTAQLSVSPGTEVVVNTVMTMTVTTREDVQSVLIKVWDNGTPLPTTKQSDWVFVKDMSIDTPGMYPVDLTVTVDAQPTIFEDVETIQVNDELRKILVVTHEDQPEASRSNLAWTYQGTIDYFKVRYGTSQNNLRLSLTTSKPEGTLVLADITKVYYAQVFPVDENGIVNGEPSDIITIWPLRETDPICGNGIVESTEQCDDGNILSWDGCDSQCMFEPIATCGNGIVETGEACDDGNRVSNDGCNATCTQIEQIAICGNGAVEIGEVCDDGNILNGDGCNSTCTVIEQPAAPLSCYTDGIALTTKKVNDKYYITWASVPRAKEYIIYRAETPVGSIQNMRQIARTTQTSFEYPFDVNSEVDKYAWYAVEAVCDETEEQKQIGDVTQVKVWPEHTILMIIMLLLLGIWWVRLIKSPS